MQSLRTGQCVKWATGGAFFALRRTMTGAKLAFTEPLRTPGITRGNLSEL